MKKILALILALTMLFTLAACGGSTAASSAAPAESVAADASVAAPEEDVEPADEPAVESAAEASVVEEAAIVPSKDVPLTAVLENVEPVSLPLTEDGYSFEFWVAAPGSIAQEETLAQSNIAYRTWQERTGVNFSFILANFFTQSDEFNLMAAAGNYPAVMNAVANLYTGGADAAIDDEIFFDMTDYLEEYAPNYYAMVHANDQLLSDVTTTGGRFVAFYALYDYEKFGLGDRGYMIREDWLDKLGMDMPKTVDELHAALTGFKDEMGAESAFAIPTSGITEMTMGAYGVYNGFYVQDGEIKFGPMEEGFKDYLQLMHDWYEEGLIFKDFYSWTNQIMFDGTDMIGAGEVALYFNETGTMETYAEYSNDPDFKLRAIAPVVAEEGGTSYQMQFRPTYIDQPRQTITTNCEEPELVMQMFDYFYSEEGVLLANFGVEGTTFEYDENGDPQLTDLILKNPDGYSYRDALALNVNDVAGSVFNPLRGAAYYTENQLSSWDDWSDQNLDYSRGLPGNGILNPDEQSQYSAIYSDISTVLEEAYIKYIIGDFSFDTYDEDFVGKMASMNIQECIDIYQTAYDRYISQ